MDYPKDYRASVQVTATDIQLAANKIRNLHIDNLNLMIDKMYDTMLLNHLGAFMAIDESNVRPPWVADLEKRWGLK